MKNSKLVIAGIAVAFIAVFAVSAQKVSIDFRLNVAQSKPADDYFSWTYNGKTIKDTLDVASGASKLKSTAEFEVVRYDNPTTKRPAIPATLREFLLYAISTRETFTEAAVTVTQEGKDIVIRFVNRNTAHQIRAVNGKINLDSSFSRAANVADNVGGQWLVKPELSKTGSAAPVSSLDWNKLILLVDAPAANASKQYSGTLNAVYKGGVLTIKGDLK
jgi:hypothetical protein